MDISHAMPCCAMLNARKANSKCTRSRDVPSKSRESNPGNAGLYLSQLLSLSAPTRLSWSYVGACSSFALRSRTAAHHSNSRQHWARARVATSHRHRHRIRRCVVRTDSCGHLSYTGKKLTSSSHAHRHPLANSRQSKTVTWTCRRDRSRSAVSAGSNSPRRASCTALRAA